MRIIIGILAVVAIVLLAVWAVDVDVTGDVELPEVEVSAEGGEMPAVDVNTVDIDATMEEESVTVLHLISKKRKTQSLPWATSTVSRGKSILKLS